MLMYEMLQNGTWQIGDNCQALIETLPMLTRDEKKPEDGIMRWTSLDICSTHD